MRVGTSILRQTRMTGQNQRPTSGNPLLALFFLREGLCSISQWTHRNMNRPLAMCQASERTGLVCFRRGYGQSTPAPVSQHVLQPDYILRDA